MAQFLIEMRVFHEQKPAGDRATSLSPSLRFEVWLRNTYTNKETLIRTFDQFDSFSCTIRPLRPVQDAAQKFLQEFAETFDHDQMEIDEKHFRAKIITEWEPFSP